MSMPVPTTRAEILSEIEAMADDLEAQVMDQDDSYSDHTPNVRGGLQRLHKLESTLKVYDRYGVDSLAALNAHPEFRRDRNLWKALHSMEKSLSRWAHRRGLGMTDADLLVAFDLEAGDGYTSSYGDDVSYQCRPGRFKWQAPDGMDQELHGNSLARAMRVLLAIPEPVHTTTQLQLFA